MTRYRKKPVEIEAMQWTGGALAASYIIDWVIANDGTANYHEFVPTMWDEDGVAIVRPEDPEHIAIRTLEGTMRADIGDWVIRGVKREFYPCKPDVFAASYEGPICPNCGEVVNPDYPHHVKQPGVCWMDDRGRPAGEPEDPRDD